MASTTPLFFKSHNNQTSRSQSQPQPQPNTNTNTNPRPDSTPTQNPKPRSRRPGRSQKGPNKIPQRGMGVEKLELERIQREKGIISPSHRILASKMLSSNNNNNNNNNNGFSNVGPLPGVPIHPYPVTLSNYYFPGQPGPAIELPSMPNHNTLSYKKKRVNGEEQNQEGVLVGFGKGKEKQNFGDYYDQSLFQMSGDFNNHGVNYGGFDVKNNFNNNYGNNYHHLGVNYGAFSGYNDFTAMSTGSEMMAIQRKLGRSKVMEYGFFPGKSDTVNEEENIKDFDFNNNDNNNNTINNYYYRSMDYLDLKLGCSDSSYTNSSPSSSLTTATNATNVVVSDTFLDLSLKLSNY